LSGCVWTQHFEAVCRSASFYVEDTEAIRNAAVEVFARYERGELAFDPQRGGLRHFLSVCVRNLARDARPHRLLCASDMGQGVQGDGDSEGRESAFERILANQHLTTTPEELCVASQSLATVMAELTEREAQVLALKSTGHSASEIQSRLGLSPEQVHKAVTSFRATARRVLHMPHPSRQSSPVQIPTQEVEA
jgi:DNA-directed RNA polymerase specialized sigma24 family protein